MGTTGDAVVRSASKPKRSDRCELAGQRCQSDIEALEEGKLARLSRIETGIGVGGDQVLFRLYPRAYQRDSSEDRDVIGEPQRQTGAPDPNIGHRIGRQCA